MTDNTDSIDLALDESQRDVEEFMTIGGQEVLTVPTLPSDEIRDLRIALMQEELNGINELVEAMKAGDMVRIADGLADLEYVHKGTAAAYGISARAVFNEAHRSNMTKFVWDEENQSYIVTKREDGKILKPDTYEEADFESVLRKLGWTGEAKPIVRVYSKPACQQCTAVKRRLDENGTFYIEEDATTDANIAYLKSLGHLQAPVTIASWADGRVEHFGGFIRDKVDALKV